MLLIDGTRCFRLGGRGQLTLGRSSDCDLPLHDPSLSRQARWTLSGTRWRRYLQKQGGQRTRIGWRKIRLGAQTSLRVDPLWQDLIVLMAVCAIVGLVFLASAASHTSRRLPALALPEAIVTHSPARTLCLDWRYEKARRKALHLSPPDQEPDCAGSLAK